MTAHTKQHFVVVVYRFQSAYAQSSYFHLKLIHDRSLSTQPFIFFDLMVLNSCRTMRISLHCQLFLTKRTPTWIHRKKQSGGKWYHHDQWLLLIDMTLKTFFSEGFRMSNNQNGFFLKDFEFQTFKTIFLKVFISLCSSKVRLALILVENWSIEPSDFLWSFIEKSNSWELWGNVFELVESLFSLII